MKFSLGLLTALAATASAVPIRIITFTEAPSAEFLPAHRIQVEEGQLQPIRPIAPCHGKRPAPSAPGRMSFASLLDRLGLSGGQSAHHDINRGEEKWQVVSALQDEEEMHRMMDGWKHRVEEMIQSAEDRVVPILQGGSVKILPVMDHDGKFDHHLEEKHRQHGDWESLEGKGGVKKHHHHGHHGYHGHRGEHQPKTFICRLGKALRSLTPTEGVAVMFVLGAGLGSLLHLVFAVVFLTARRLRCGKFTCAERRAARKARRAARKAGKAGPIALDGSENENEEVTPSHAHEETAPLVEKA